ncbi:hypothetical protein ACJMK2_041193, partial [Sinanodonta woodiana]
KEAQQQQGRVKKNEKPGTTTAAAATRDRKEKTDYTEEEEKITEKRQRRQTEMIEEHSAHCEENPEKTQENLTEEQIFDRERVKRRKGKNNRRRTKIDEKMYGS